MTTEPAYQSEEGKKALRRQARGRYVAFSLIEVVMAMAIVSFSLLAIIGLLPIGLSSVRDSENDQAMGAIATQVRGQLQQISFNSTNTGNIINQLAGSTNSYSSEGLLITTSVPTNIVAFYRATFTTAPAGASLSSSSQSFNTTNSEMVTVTVAYPAPVYNQTNTFSILATCQTGL